METNYLAGYYLIKTVPIDYWDGKNTAIRSCSGCFNIHAFDYWCTSWMSTKDNCHEKTDLGLSDEVYEAIQQWNEKRFRSGANVLPDIETALEFKNLFFKARDDVKIYSVYFPESDADLLISQFANGENTKYFSYKFEDFELRKNLIKKTEEINSSHEDLLGYDFIGVEASGSFHTFYCHGLAQTLIEKFDLTLNEFGLFDEPKDSTSIREYLNEPNAPVEPVPWYIVKVKLVKNASPLLV